MGRCENRPYHARWRTDSGRDAFHRVRDQSSGCASDKSGSCGKPRAPQASQDQHSVPSHVTRRQMGRCENRPYHARWRVNSGRDAFHLVRDQSSGCASDKSGPCGKPRSPQASQDQHSVPSHATRRQMGRCENRPYHARCGADSGRDAFHRVRDQTSGGASDESGSCGKPRAPPAFQDQHSVPSHATRRQMGRCGNRPYHARWCADSGREAFHRVRDQASGCASDKSDPCGKPRAPPAFRDHCFVPSFVAREQMGRCENRPYHARWRTDSGRDAFHSVRDLSLLNQPWALRHFGSSLRCAAQAADAVQVQAEELLLPRGGNVRHVCAAGGHRLPISAIEIRR